MIKFVSMEGIETYQTFDEVPHKIVDYTDDLSEIRAKGGCVHRAELDNKPIYEGFLGPTWDGGNYRYETQEIYDILST